jgi:hypothetical protein
MNEWDIANIILLLSSPYQIQLIFDKEMLLHNCPWFIYCIVIVDNTHKKGNAYTLL